jgi:hypothetical protein
MSPNDVIEFYVRDVARNLPGKARYEIAEDLRTQLRDELAGRAEAAGRAPDAELALSLVRDFGRPEQLATQYHPPFSIIDPADTRRFVVVSVIGWGMLATIIVTLQRLGVPPAQDLDIGLPTWIGMMTIVFGIRTFLRNREPDKYAWRPSGRIIDLSKVNYPGLAVSAAATIFFLAVYLWPGPVIEFLSGGRVAADSLAYRPDFADPKGLRSPWLVIVLAAGLALYGWVAIKRRWSRLTRWLYIFFLFHVAYQLGWHMAYGPVFQSADVERIVFLGASLLILGIGIDLWLRVLREWDWIEPPKRLSAAAQP